MVRNAHKFQLCLGTQKKLLMLTKQSSLRLTHDTKVVCINDDERALPILKLSKHWDVTNSQNQNDVGSDGKVKGSTKKKGTWRAPNLAEVLRCDIFLLIRIRWRWLMYCWVTYVGGDSWWPLCTWSHTDGDIEWAIQAQYWVTCDKCMHNTSKCDTYVHRYTQSSMVQLRRYWTAMISYTIDK